MGRGIVYCGDCGRRLQDDDFEKGRASEIDYVPYCAECRTPPAPPQKARISSGHIKIPSGQWVASKKRSSTRSLPIVPEDLPPPTSRSRPSAEGDSKKIFLISGGVVGVAVLILAIALMSGGGDAPPPAAAPSPAVAAPAPIAGPRTDGVRRAAPVAASRTTDPASQRRIFNKLSTLASTSRNPEEILFECDKAKAALRGTKYMARIRSIEEKALKQKRERDMKRRFDTSVADVKKMIDSDRLFKREGEVVRLLGSLIGMAEGAKKQELQALLRRYEDDRVLGRIKEAEKVRDEDELFEHEEEVFRILDAALAVGGPHRSKAQAAIDAYGKYRVEGRVALAKKIRAGDPKFEREDEVRGLLEEALELREGNAPEIRKVLADYVAAFNEILRSRRTGPFELDRKGYVRNWLVVGPLPNPNHEGFEKDYLTTEASATPAERIEVKPPGGSARSWRSLRISGERIKFGSVCGAGNWTVCYVAAWVESDSAQDVEIRLGSDDGFKLWLGGKLLGSNHVHRSCSPDSERYPVKLARGRQLLLFKVANGDGGYEGMLRIVKPDGAKAPGIRIYN